MNRRTALKILGFDSEVSVEEIKFAYRVKAKACHPDRFGHNSLLREQAEVNMKEINLAFHVLISSQEQCERVCKRKRDNNNRKNYNQTQESKQNVNLKSHGWSAFNIFSGFFKKIREKQVRENTEKKYGSSQNYGNGYNNSYSDQHHRRTRPEGPGRNNDYSGCRACRYRTCKKSDRIKKFDAVLKRNMDRATFPTFCINRGAGRISIKSRYMVMQQYKRYIKRKRILRRIGRTGEWRPVQKIAPISPVQKIT